MRLPNFGLRTVGIAMVALLLPTIPETLGQEAIESIQKPFLWRIKAHPDDKPSYLFGTIHLSRPSVTKLPPRVLAALHASDAVYTEIPMDPPTLVRMTPHLFLPEGKTLADVLPKDLLKEAQGAVKEIDPKLPFDPFSRMQVWAFAAGLAGLEDQIKYPGALAQDMVIFQRGALDGKEVGGIESPEEQIAIFDELTVDEQIEMLRDGLKQMRDIRATGQSPSEMLVGLYLTGDIDALGIELNKWLDPEGSELSAKLVERLLTRRNRLMAGRIAAKLRTEAGKTFFFAVGAAHLYGPNGLVNLLSHEGIEVSRVGN